MIYSTEPMSLNAKESSRLEAFKYFKKGQMPTDEQIKNLYVVRQGGYTGVWFWHEEN